MKHNRKRICKIVDELMTYLFNMGATDITMNVKEEKQQFIMYIKSDYTRMNEEVVNKLIQRLNITRQIEMEEYYWELTGDSDIDTELTLVGMMIDKAEVHLTDNTIEITLYRYK